MAVEKVYKCDLCGEFVPKDALRRLGVRALADRVEDTDWVDVGPECHGATVLAVFDHAERLRGLAVHGE
jgi:hypothetical protein